MRASMRGLFKDRSLNFPAWLFVFYSFILGLNVELSFSIPISLFTELDQDSCYAPTPQTVVYPTFLFLIQSFLFCLVFPFTGWVSDSIVGRRKSIGCSIWLSWFGGLLQCISFCIQYGTCGVMVAVAKYGTSGIAYVLLMVGNAGLFTNIPTFGIDQLFDKPHTHSRAFIHWSVWGLYLGFTASYIAFVQNIIYFSLLIQLTACVVFLFTSIALCLHILFHETYQIVQRSSKDPYKVAINVLIYAKNNKSPHRRSAFTFWEDEIPSRIDLAKTKYGGLYSIEEVEDTKTILQMIVIFLASIGFFVPYYHTLIGALFYVNEFGGATSVNGLGSFILWRICDSSIVFIIPILQLVIIPCFPKLEYFIGNPLRGLIVCFYFQIAALIPMAFLELFRYSDASFSKNISFLYFGIPLFLSGISDALNLIFSLEFICSQAPSGMKGLLTGIYWFVRNLYVDIGALFSLIHFNELYKVSYGFWILVIQLLICVCGLILFSNTANKWYKNRKRNDYCNIQEHVEDVFERDFLHEEIAKQARTKRLNYSSFNDSSQMNSNL